MSDDEKWMADLGFDEEPTVSAGKRIGVQWCPWRGDWFTSWSPRNSNSNAEGEWDQWVDLAQRVLADPLTKIVRPEAYAPDPKLIDSYTGAERELTAGELRARFESKVDR